MAARRIPVAGIVKFISDNINNYGARHVRWTVNPTHLNIWWTSDHRACSTNVASDVNHTSKTAGSQPPSPEILEKELNLKSDVEKLNKELKVLTEKFGDVEDKYKRSLAESENVRKRFMKQVEDAKLFGIQGFCKDLLEVADVLGRATESVPKEEIRNSNPYLKSLYEGLVMTETQLQSVFKRHGLVPVNPLNEKFDPNLHEALFQQDVQGKEPGTVVVVSKIGYKLHERVIRPALVGVAKGQ